MEEESKVILRNLVAILDGQTQNILLMKEINNTLLEILVEIKRRQIVYVQKEDDI